MDFPYFEEILQNVSEKAFWKVYYKSDDEYDKFKKSLMQIGITNYQLKSSESFWGF